MKILITGAAGFIGSNLVRRLLKSKHKIIGVDNLITGVKSNIADLSKNPGFKFILKDITDKNFPKLFSKEKIEQIYHLACPTGVPNIEPLAEQMLLACSIGTRNVLEVARIHNSRVIFTSSSEVYGDPQVFPQSEEYTGNVDPIGARSPYEEGKRFSESLFKMYCSKYNLDCSVVRLFNTYGPGMSAKDTRVIPQFLSNAQKNTPLIIKGSGKNTRTYCFVDDLINGLILVMEKGQDGEVYNLGSSKEISVLELADLVLKLTHSKSKIKHIKDSIPDHKGRRPELKKIKKLGWSQKVDLKFGIIQTYSAFLDKQLSAP
jgi:nucleoside-diphosphate-sugar epimerase